MRAARASLCSAFTHPGVQGLNAAGLQTERLIPVLEQLTHTNGLRATTWRAWDLVLSEGNTLTGTRMWCPYCLAEWKAAGQTIYEPLIWFLQPVTICPRHKQPLSFSVPARGLPENATAPKCIYPVRILCAVLRLAGSTCRSQQTAGQA